LPVAAIYLFLLIHKKQYFDRDVDQIVLLLAFPGCVLSAGFFVFIFVPSLTVKFHNVFLFSLRIAAVQLPGSEVAITP